MQADKVVFPALHTCIYARHTAAPRDCHPTCGIFSGQMLLFSIACMSVVRVCLPEC